MSNFKSVLVTGVAGFIASHLVIRFVKKNPSIHYIGVDKFDYNSNIKNIDSIRDQKNFEFVRADITDIETMDGLFRQYRFDAVVHLAAMTHVDVSFFNSIEFTKNNVLGTHVLLELCRKYGISKFLHMSTDEVYGSKDDISTEDSTLDPTNPYSASKAAAEHLVKSYFHSFKLPVVIVRANNCIGPVQNIEKCVPRFTLRLLRGKPCTIHGTGNQMRNFIYVDDLCEALEIILEKGKISQVYNVASENEISIIDLTYRLIKMIYPDCEDPNIYIKYVEDRHFNDQRYNISSNKLKELGWEQKTGLDETLHKTVEWYRANQDYWDEKQLGNLFE
jgi:dTDP-glucose 4,6-dehydratase